MTEAQLRLYRREWGAARKVLRARGFAPSAADAERHALHVQAIGTDKSSLDFTNKDLDKVLAAFRAISRSADLRPQIDAQQQPITRRRWLINELCRQLGHDEGFAYGIAHEMHRGDRDAKRKKGARIASADLDELGERDLDKIIIALRKQIKRDAKGTTAGAASTADNAGEPQISQISADSNAGETAADAAGAAELDASNCPF